MLAGLLRCGHCGRKLYVGYGGKAGRYYCQGALVNHGTERCISFGGMRIDRAVGTEVLRVLKPLGIDAAVKALEAQTSETSPPRGNSSWRCSRRASRRRMLVGNTMPSIPPIAWWPASWSAAGTRRCRSCTGSRARSPQLEARKPAPLGEKERQQLMQLGADLELAWSHPAATAATRKRILRAALHEIVVRIEGGFIEMVLHWQGGDHTALKLKMNGAGKHRWTVPEDTLSLIRELARLMPDQQIARLLNRAGKPTGRGNGWTKARVCSFRNHHDIAVYREGEWAERGEITLEAAAQIIDVSVMTALRMIRRGIIKGRQHCRGAPWVIKAEDMAAHRARKRIAAIANIRSRPAEPYSFNDIEGTHYGAWPLGHAKLDTTALYTRVATTTIRAVTSPLDRLGLLDGRPRPAADRRRAPPGWRSQISSIAMGRLAARQCRPCEPRPAPGHVGDRELPHGRARRSCRALRGLRPPPHRLQLLPQPALPQVPGRGGAGLAGRPRGRSAAGRLFPRRLHAAGRDRRRSPTRTRRWSTTCCSAPPPRRCSPSPPIPSTSAPASASSPCSTPGARR